MKSFYLLLVLAVFSSAQAVWADDSFIVTVQKKQDEKVKTRWSLASWFETKEKIRLMDMWLALHTPSPYEFELGGTYQLGANGGTNYTGFTGHFTAMAAFVGLEVSGETASPDHTALSGLLNFRLFGYDEQGTHITLKVGYRNFFDTATYRNIFTGAQVGIALNRFFGIEGTVLRDFDTMGSSGLNLNGWRYLGGAFIDFSALRIFGNYFSESYSYSSGTAVVRTGLNFGACVYF